MTSSTRLRYRFTTSGHDGFYLCRPRLRRRGRCIGSHIIQESTTGRCAKIDIESNVAGIIRKGNGGRDRARIGRVVHNIVTDLVYKDSATRGFSTKSAAFPHFDTIPECDGQTDRRTDGFAVACTALAKLALPRCIKTAIDNSIMF